MHKHNSRKPTTLPPMVSVQTEELENLSVDSNAMVENADNKSSMEQIKQGEATYSVEKNGAFMNSNGTFFRANINLI